MRTLLYYQVAAKLTIPVYSYMAAEQLRGSVKPA